MKNLINVIILNLGLKHSITDKSKHLILSILIYNTMQSIQQMNPSSLTSKNFREKTGKLWK